MGDLSGFAFCVVVSPPPPFPQSPVFLIGDEGTGKEESSLYKVVFSVFCSFACVQKSRLPLPFMAPSALPWLDLPQQLEITQEIVQNPPWVRSCPAGGTHSSAARTGPREPVSLHCKSSSFCLVGS